MENQERLSFVKNMIFYFGFFTLIILGVLSFYIPSLEEVFITSFLIKIPAQVNILCLIIAVVLIRLKHNEEGPWIVMPLVLLISCLGFVMKLFSIPFGFETTGILIIPIIILTIGIYTPIVNSVEEIQK